MKTLRLRTLAEAEDAIKNRQQFVMRDTLSGTAGWTGIQGFLPEEYLESIKSATYVVLSYGTPIAWIDELGKAVVPDVGYSPTTGQHQYLAAHALDVDFRPARGRKIVDIPKNDVAPWGAPRRLRRGGIDG
jgi:hypothetical protein